MLPPDRKVPAKGRRPQRLSAPLPRPLMSRDSRPKVTIPAGINTSGHPMAPSIGAYRSIFAAPRIVSFSHRTIKRPKAKRLLLFSQSVSLRRDAVSQRRRRRGQKKKGSNLRVAHCKLITATRRFDPLSSALCPAASSWLASRRSPAEARSPATGQPSGMTWRRREVKTTPIAVPSATSESRRGLPRMYLDVSGDGAPAKAVLKWRLKLLSLTAGQRCHV
jgi:hypothetical protein